MSVLVKDMKMPENCIRCPLQFGGWCYVAPAEIDDRVASTVDEALEQGKPDWCPLVEVPIPRGRLIDADDLIDWSEIVPLTGDGGIDINDFEEKLKSMPAIDAVPSEMLYSFIREIGTITYGKERFFHLARVKILSEEIEVHSDLWYDRKSCEWITTQTAIEECLKAVRELDDDVLCAGI